MTFIRLATMIAFNHHRPLLLIIAGLNLLIVRLTQVQAVSPGQLINLTREQLLALDSEVSEYFVESYEELDLNETHRTSFDEQLFKSIKSLRHTTVVNHFDFRYTNNETKWNSMGARVNVDLCKRQLRMLQELGPRTLLATDQTDQEAPLSVIDFFDASGKTGSGVLNGDFIWLGSYTSCQHAEISAKVLSKSSLSAFGYGEIHDDIKGRYCVAHLKAKSWPKWDMYFEDRLSLRRGVCLPESCHSALYDEDGEIRELVDYLSRFNLMPPYNGNRYETTMLYCLPDEDSPFRQLDLGAKLFIAFVALWLMITLYANVKYHRRKQALRTLRDAVDIKMIINERRSDLSAEDESKAEPAETSDETTINGHSTMNYLETQFLGGGSGGKNKAAGSSTNSAQSSVANTPLPSDLEDADSDPNHLIEPFRTRKRKQRSKKANVNYSYAKASNSSDEQAIKKTPEEHSAAAAAAAAAAAPETLKQHQQQSTETFDFVRDFSIESNLNWLFKPRANPIKRPNTQTNQTNANVVLQQQQPRVGSPIGVARRTSNSNEALIKELQAGRNQDGQQPKVAVLASSPTSSSSSSAPDDELERRVDIDILDGLKVFATIWIILGHTMMFFFVMLSDIRFGAERMFEFTMVFTINTLQVVGLFYVITGCLLTYISFSKAKRKQLLNPFFWLLVLIGRYIRLMPTYLLVFWFARHVSPYTGAGRDWLDYRTDEEHPRGFCGRESWWIPLSMSAADIKIPMDCVPQAWYLSDDFRTLLVLPAYVFLLAKNALLGYSAILATFAYSTYRLASILKAANIDYKIVLLWQPHVYALMVDRLHYVYTDFFVRMSTYLLGVIVGHLLYLYERRAIKQVPRWLKMRYALVFAALFFYGANLLSTPAINQFLPAREDLNSDVVVWLIPLFKGAMELAIAVIILLLVTGRGFTWARALLSSQAMKILSNISYVVFLIHVEIMYKLPTSNYESNWWYLFLYSSLIIAFSHFAAFFIHLLFEIPVNNLTRRLLKRAVKLVS